MRLKSVVIAMCAAGAFAQGVPEFTNSVVVSVLSVLATAIPPESISLATQNPTAFASALASELSAGSTPGWFQSLPADVKSELPLLYPATTPATTTASATSYAVTSNLLSTGGASISASNSGSLNSTAITSVNSPTLSRTSGSPSSAAATKSSASTGGASYPTAVVGAGIAGAIGFLGMLAM